MNIEPTIDHPIIDPTAVLALPELFSMLDVVEADIADEMTRIQHKRTIVAEIRGAIEQRLRTDGTASVTDAATGYRARIETRTTHRIIEDEAFKISDWLKATGRWDDYTYTAVDEAAVVLLAKGGETIPGIAQVTTERLVITPPKGGK